MLVTASARCARCPRRCGGGCCRRGHHDLGSRRGPLGTHHTHHLPAGVYLPACRRTTHERWSVKFMDDTCDHERMGLTDAMNVGERMDSRDGWRIDRWSNAMDRRNTDGMQYICLTWNIWPGETFSGTATVYCCVPCIVFCIIASSSSRCRFFAAATAPLPMIYGSTVLMTRGDRAAAPRRRKKHAVIFAVQTFEI